MLGLQYQVKVAKGGPISLIGLQFYSLSHTCFHSVKYKEDEQNILYSYKL